VPLIRIGLSAAIAVLALTLTAFLDGGNGGRADVGGLLRLDAPASAPWCARMDGPVGNSCRYSTFEQCLSAASSVGVCRPNPAAVITDEGPYRTYQSVYL
jgi:hypothetical protein